MKSRTATLEQKTRRIALVWLLPAIAVASLGGASATWIGEESRGTTVHAGSASDLGDWLRDPKGAERKVLDWLSVHPKDVQALSALARIYRESGRTAAAKATYEKALGLRPDHPESLQGLAELFASAGKHDLALSYWQRACRAAPGDFRAWRGLALSAHQAKDPLLAMSAIQRSLKENPDQEDLRSLLMELAMSDGDFSKQAQAGPPAIPGMSSGSTPNTSDPLRHLPEHLRPRIPR